MSILTPITNFVSRMFRPSAKTEPEKVASPTVTFAKERETPPMEEITTSEIKGISSMLGHADGNPDEVLKKQGISVYDDMVAKDAHIYAVYSTRKLSVALTPWENTGFLKMQDGINQIKAWFCMGTSHLQANRYHGQNLSIGHLMLKTTCMARLHLSQLIGIVGSSEKDGNPG